MSAEAAPGLAAEGAGGALREAFDLRGRWRRHPYEIVAGAAGMGFVLGGGLFTRLTARTVENGLRIGLTVALRMLEEQIVEVITGSQVDTNRENDK